ncbi:MAG: cation transporter [Candidatus Heimdallarchaeota archaeon]|jgi:cation diffusion facilitator family transporter|nr:cation transporter [Candidatus Heimdallarchaeota archaeon]MCK4254570.1 cation transporter [Candidatus Heimdallarchaeota archaeon]
MVSFSSATIANILSVGVNSLLVALKLIIGFFTGSISLIADGFDSILDLVTATFAGVGEKISKKPADSSHPFGHHKFQLVFSIAIALTLFISSYFIASESIERLVNQTLLPVNYLYLIIIAAAISFVGKIAMSISLFKIGKKINSVVIIANAKNYRTDAFSSIFVIIAVVGSYFSIWWLDPICAFIIVGLIIYTGFEIAKVSIPDLLDRGAPQEVLDKLTEIALSHPEVKEVHIVRLRTILGYYTGDFHILVDPQMTIFEAHEVSEKVKQNLENEGTFRDIIIHLEPFTPEESLEGKS